MMPNLGEQPVMAYVRHLEDKCRAYESAKGAIDRRVFLWGFLLGSLFSAVIAACYIWRYGG